MINGVNKTKQALWVGVGSSTAFVFTIVTTAVLARYLSKEDLGTYRQILFIYNSLLILFSAGLPNVYAYYLPRYSIPQGKVIVKKINRLLFLSGSLFSLFLFFAADLIAIILNNKELGAGLRYFSPIPLLLFPTLGLEGIFASYNKTIYIAIYNFIARFLMGSIIIFMIIYLGNDYLNAILGWILSSCFVLILALYIKNIPFRNEKPDIANLGTKKIMHYALPLVFASISGIAIRSADQFYISRYFGASIFAVYAIGFIQLPFVGMITGAASTVLLPLFSDLLNQKGRLRDVAKIWQESLIKSATLIYPIIIFFFFTAEILIKLLYTEKFIASASYFKIALIINFFNIIIFAPLFLALGKTKLYAKIHLFFAVTAWLGGFLVIIFFNSPLAVALFSVINNIFLILYCFNKAAFLISIPIRKLLPIRSIILILSHSLLSIFITLFVFNLFIVNDNIIIEILFKFIIYAILIFSLSKIFNINYLKIIKPLFYKTG